MEIHEKGYWIGGQMNAHHFTDEALAQKLSEVLAGKSVVDFGCGNGYYVTYMREQGIDCDGYDGNPLTKSLSGGVAEVQDLTEDFTLDKPYDWVLCLEVGEHIPNKHEEVLLNNIDKHNTQGVILSWAIEDQPGVGHVNCHNNDYVIDLFRKRGYAYDMVTSEVLRQNISTCTWFKNTIMVFTNIKD